MQEIFKNEFVQINIWEEKKAVEVVWLPFSAQMNENNYKEFMPEVTEVIAKHRPTNCIINAIDLKFDLNEDLQTWTTTHVSPLLAKAGMKRIAYITSQDNLTAEQIEELKYERESGYFLTTYVVSNEEAWHWFKDKDKV